MSGEKVTFYDIPSRHDPPRGWSPNTFKTLLTLNLKGIPYETKYVEFADIAPTLSSLGAPAGTGSRPYTLPAITTPSHPVPIMDSWTIGEYLDEHYPDTPKVFPLPGSKAIARALLAYAGTAIHPTAMPTVLPLAAKLLSDRSWQYCKERQEKLLGISLEEFAKKGNADAMLEAISKIDDVLAAEEGPYVMGQTPSFADLIIAGFLGWFKELDKDLLEKVLSLGDGHLRTLWEASQKWF